MYCSFLLKVEAGNRQYALSHDIAQADAVDHEHRKNPSTGKELERATITSIVCLEPRCGLLLYSET